MDYGLTGSVAVAVSFSPVKDRYLVLQRPASAAVRPGLWEFPGGKVEPGESPSEAVVRELREETGLSGELERAGQAYTIDSPDGRWRMYPFLVALDPGELELSAEHVAHRWVTVEEITGLETAGQLDSLRNLGLL